MIYGSPTKNVAVPPFGVPPHQQQNFPVNYSSLNPIAPGAQQFPPYYNANPMTPVMPPTMGNIPYNPYAAYGQVQPGQQYGYAPQYGNMPGYAPGQPPSNNNN